MWGRRMGVEGGAEFIEFIRELWARNLAATFRLRFPFNRLRFAGGSKLPGCKLCELDLSAGVALDPFLVVVNIGKRWACSFRAFRAAFIWAD